MTLDAGRKDAARQTDVALHHPSEHLSLDVARTAEVQGARDVGSAVQVLSARIAQVDLLDVQRSIRRFGRLVVDDRTIRTGRRDGLERVLNEVLLLLSQLVQLLGGADLRLSAWVGRERLSSYANLCRLIRAIAQNLGQWNLLSQVSTQWH